MVDKKNGTFFIKQNRSGKPTNYTILIAFSIRQYFIPFYFWYTNGPVLREKVSGLRWNWSWSLWMLWRSCRRGLPYELYYITLSRSWTFQPFNCYHRIHRCQVRTSRLFKVNQPIIAVGTISDASINHRGFKTEAVHVKNEVLAVSWEKWFFN